VHKFKVSSVVSLLLSVVVSFVSKRTTTCMGYFGHPLGCGTKHRILGYSVV